MAIHEVLFPVGISYGTAGGPGFDTSIVRTDSGAEERVARWTGARRQYNVGYNIKTYADLATLKEFFIARQGAAFGFLFKDFTDYTSSSTGLDTALGGAAPTKDDVQIGVGDGSETNFQLIKKYVSTPVTRTRNITKPVSGTVLIALDGVNQTSGFTVSTITGVVTFTSPPGVGVVITAGFEFYVPVRFGESVDRTLSIAIEDFGSGGIPDIPMIEVRDEGEVNDEFYYGGATTFPMLADTTLSVNHGRVIILDPVAIFQLFMPDITNLQPGGPHFYLTNISSLASVTLRDFGDTTTLKNLATNSTTIALISELSGVKTWRLF